MLDAGCLILDELLFKGCDFLGGGWEAGEVEGGAADEGAGIGGRSGVRAFGHVESEQFVDGGGAFHRWFFNRLVGPETFWFVTAVGPFGRECAGGFHGDAVFGAPCFGVGSRHGAAFCLIRPRGTTGDPVFDPV